jgi:hypothetical protein
MEIKIETKAKDGHLILYIIDRKENQILVLRDSQKGSCMLVPGKTYRFEWHVWSSKAAEYSITAEVNPENEGFPKFDWAQKYDKAGDDMGGFYFTIK